jgi:glycosyltransferase involved in cell wall biosynthesis
MNAPIVFASAGFLRNTKGYHVALEALAKFKRLDPSFKYLIIGDQQPQFTSNRWYQEELERIVSRLGLNENVLRISAHLSPEELLSYMLAADIGLVTYTEEAQNASGILPLMLGLGRVVIATRFAYAQAIENRIEGLFLAEMNDPDDLLDLIIRITADRVAREQLMMHNYKSTREWVWPSCAVKYRLAFEQAVGRK